MEQPAGNPACVASENQALECMYAFSIDKHNKSCITICTVCPKKKDLEFECFNSLMNPRMH